MQENIFRGLTLHVNHDDDVQHRPEQERYICLMKAMMNMRDE